MDEIVGFQLADDNALFRAISLEAFVRGEFGVTDATRRVEVLSSESGVFHPPEQVGWPPVYRVFEYPAGVAEYPPPVSIEVVMEDIHLTHFIRDPAGVLGWIGYGKGTDTLAFWSLIEASDDVIGRTPMEVSTLLTGRYRGPHGWG